MRTLRRTIHSVAQVRPDEISARESSNFVRKRSLTTLPRRFFAANMAFRLRYKFVARAVNGVKVDGITWIVF
jgi:hypothetical protein